MFSEVPNGNAAVVPSVTAATGMVRDRISAIKDDLGGERRPGVPSCWMEVMVHAALRPCGCLVHDFSAAIHAPGAGWIALFDRTGTPAQQCRLLAFAFSDYLLNATDLSCLVPPPGVGLREWRRMVSAEFARSVAPS